MLVQTSKHISCLSKQVNYIRPEIHSESKSQRKVANNSSQQQFRLYKRKLNLVKSKRDELLCFITSIHHVNILKLERTFYRFMYAILQ